jgi:tRNA pseudouridine55 synthase
MQNRDVHGVLLLDKPVGVTSNAALQRVRRLLQARRAGHTGTLDPMASGLLVLCFGEATKFAAGMLDADKAYVARVRLGVTTSTGDAEGEITSRRDVRVSREQIDAALHGFRGEVEQVPPMHSALKHRGRPLYSYARKGEAVERAPRKVAIRELVLDRLEGEDLDLSVVCSKGTYVRTLAEDIGEALGCGAHLAGLRRTAIGPFTIGQATAIEDFERASLEERERGLLPVETLLQSRRRLALDVAAEARFRQGQRVPAQSGMGSVAVYAADGRLLGLGEIDASGVLHPKRLISIGSLPATR